MKRRLEDDNEESGLSEYEKIRLRNIKEREEKLLSLGIIPYAKPRKENVISVKPTIKTNSKPVRSSSRLRGLKPDESAEVTNEPHEETDNRKYIPKRDLTLKELLSYEYDPEELFQKEESFKDTLDSYKYLRTESNSGSSLNLPKLKIKENGVFKVTRSRITAMAFHPSTDKTLLFTGDIYGYTSIFNIRDRKNELSFKSNDWSINCMSIDNHNESKLIMTSKDGSMKLMDLKKQRLEVLYGKDDSFASYHSQMDAFQYLLSFGNDGYIGVIDTRKDKNNFASKIQVFPSGQIAKTVSYKDNLFVVGNSKSDCLVYDVRISKSPYAELKGHFGSVTSAFFNPSSNSPEILTTVSKDKILLYKLSNGNSIVKPSWSVNHNNQTGRWLSTFKAVWHPRKPYIFVGSMQKNPRRMDVFKSNGIIARVLMGECLTSIASVVIPHPKINMVAGGNSSGKVFVFEE